MYDRFEIDFLPIGENGCSGDAICVRYLDSAGQYHIHVIDGGFKSSGESVVKFIKTYYGNPTYIDHVVLTHADGDHAGGLIEIVKNFEVGTLWMNRPWRYASEIIHNFHGNWTVSGIVEELRANFSTLAELEELAISKGINIQEAFQGSVIGPFTVLAPSRERFLQLLPEMDKTPTVVDRAVEFAQKVAERAISFIRETWTGESLSQTPPATSAANEASLVQAAILGTEKILLTGDAGPGTLSQAADYADGIAFTAPTFVQIPHHGSRRNVTPAVLDRWLGTPLPDNAQQRRGVAYCSAAAEDARHPKKKVLNAFLRRGYPSWVTNGISWWHKHNMPDRPNWNYRDPQPFHDEVED